MKELAITAIAAEEHATKVVDESSETSDVK